MLTSSSSVVLLCPTIPITDQARRYGSWPSSSSSSLATLGAPAAAAAPPTVPSKSIGDCSSSSTPNLLTSSGGKGQGERPAAAPSCSHHSQRHGAAAAVAANSLDHSSMSDVHMCPYPRRGLLSNSTGPSVSSRDRKTTPPAAVCGPAAQACGPSSSSAKTMDSNYSLDLERITNTVNKLESSGWYYGKLSWQQATDMLRSTPVGTFLIRDSSDPQYLFALSVQTERGPTSIRIHYSNGQFKLDAEDLIAGKMPLFDCVVKLVEYYVKLSQTDKAKAHVWLDDSGRRDRQIRLNTPLYHNVPQLQHLCRLVINGQVPMQRINELQQLPNALKMYIRDYPYQR